MAEVIRDGNNPNNSLKVNSDGSINAVTSASAGSSSLISGTLNASTTATALPSNACIEVIVQNDPTNSGINIGVGGSAAQNVVLTPGQSITLSVINTNVIYVLAASGTPKVNYLARN